MNCWSCCLTKCPKAVRQYTKCVSAAAGESKDWSAVPPGGDGGITAYRNQYPEYSDVNKVISPGTDISLQPQLSVTISLVDKV